MDLISIFCVRKEVPAVGCSVYSFTLVFFRRLTKVTSIHHFFFSAPILSTGIADCTNLSLNIVIKLFVNLLTEHISSNGGNLVSQQPDWSVLQSFSEMFSAFCPCSLRKRM